MTPADLLSTIERALDEATRAAQNAAADSIGTRLHLTEHLRNEFGMKYADMAAGQIASRPHVHDIDPERLPAAIRPGED